ncbi:MAG TPA: hypothetical protein VFW25_03380 [Silvibacterium sp.]|nr:hypothetical protein [Silvibacterium sp.]
MASRGNQIAEALILALLISAPALTNVYKGGVSDPDIWWHLRTGEWILRHGVVPHKDYFSAFSAGKPWAAYSWLFELLVFKCFPRLGLVGIVAYTSGMLVAITAAVYHLIRRLQADFTACALLTLAATFAMTRVYTPRPWLFSILFFTLQLDILMNVRRTGRVRELLWLPLIYAIWANVHIEFFYGAVILALALGEAIVSRWRAAAKTQLSATVLSGICIGCFAASLVNPYGWHIYEIGFDMAAHSGVNFVGEMQAIPFRATADFFVLFLAFAAAAGLVWPPSGTEWPRRLPVFETALLTFAAIVSFRSTRDMWLLAVVAAALVAQQFSSRKQPRPVAVFAVPIIAVGTALALCIGVRVFHLDNARLQDELASKMPVQAVKLIKDKGYVGPLYNSFDWGGYLIWDLRMPVSIDGRTNLVGDKRMARSAATWDGEPDWFSDADLAAAGLVIAPVKEPLTQLLRTDSRFQLAYEDKIAAVFIARRLHEIPAMSSSTQ